MANIPLEAYGATDFSCSYCGSTKEAMTVWQHQGPLSSWIAISKGDVHAVVSQVLYLCFRGCQHFSEPFKANGCTNEYHWNRVDQWQGIKRAQPRIRQSNGDWRRGLMEMARDHQLD
jgi:hypothetical protein